MGEMEDVVFSCQFPCESHAHQAVGFFHKENSSNVVLLTVCFGTVLF